MKWTTFEDKVVDMETVSHQHLSNAIWYWRVLFSRPDEDLADLLDTLKRRFKDIVLPYRPHPGFTQEITMLESRGFIKKIGDNHAIIWWKGMQIGEIINPLKENTSSMSNIVTLENLKPGNRVVRGPKWHYPDQDHDSKGNQTVGTIIGTSYTNWIKVKWDGGQINTYSPNGELVFLFDESSTKKETTMANIIVTREIAHVGMRVKRGPDWNYGGQDSVGGEYVSGTITFIHAGSVQVKWDNGGQYHYYIDDRRDLYFDDSLVTKKDTTNAVSKSFYLGNPYSLITSLAEIKIGDTIKCTNKNYFYAEEEELVIDKIYTVTNIETSTNRIKVSPGSACNFWVGISNFALVSQSPTPGTIARNKRPIVMSSGGMDWSNSTDLFKVGATVKCIYADAYSQANGVKKGDVITISAISGTALKKTGSTHWMDRTYFDLSGGGAINMSFIYSQIKTSKDESIRNTSDANRSIQVQRPVATIRHAERSPGRGLRCGGSKATIAK